MAPLVVGFDLDMTYSDGRGPVPGDLSRLRSAVTPALPGALQAVRRLQGRSLVVTGKYTPNARLHLDHLEGMVLPDLLAFPSWLQSHWPNEDTAP